MSCYDRLPIPAPPLVTAAESKKMAVERQTSMSSSTTSATSGLSIDSSYTGSGMDSSSESAVSTSTDQRRRRRSLSPGIPEEESAPPLLSSRRSSSGKSPSQSPTVPSSPEASAFSKPSRRVPRRNRSMDHDVTSSATTAAQAGKAPLRRNRSFHTAPQVDSRDAKATATTTKKTVSFDLDQNTRHVYKNRRRPNQSLRTLWYPLKDLETLLEHEVRIHKRSTAVTLNGRQTRQHSKTCARGLEETLQGISKSEKCKAYVWKMLGAQSRLRQAHHALSQDSTTPTLEDQRDGQWEAMRLFSREHTQTNRQAAYQMGLQDASDVTLFLGHPPTATGQQPMGNNKTNHPPPADTKMENSNKTQPLLSVVESSPKRKTSTPKRSWAPLFCLTVMTPSCEAFLPPSSAMVSTGSHLSIQTRSAFVHTHHYKS